MKTLDLTTTDGRKEAIKNLNLDCKAAFINAGIELSVDALFRLHNTALEISIKETDVNDSYYGFSAFGSTINLYNKSNTTKEAEINFGVSGAFNPERKSSYWVTIQAASLLKNWNKVCELLETFCFKYTELEKNIMLVNKVK